MSDEYKQKIGIPENHELVQTNSEWKQKHGQDTDTYWYNEVNKDGEVINKYIVLDSTSMYPPFDRNITWEKYKTLE